MRIGLFGGTFDPLHIGHLLIAEVVRGDFPLDRVMFIPAAISPHKVGYDLSPPEVRLEMVQCAIERDDGFEVSDVEIRNNNISYTVDTIKWFRAEEKWRNEELYLIIGSDSFFELNTWKNPEMILQQVHVLVVNRPGFDIQNAEQQYRDRITVINGPLLDVSSSDIRERVRLGKSIRYRVPECVEKIIFQKGLYR